MTHVVGLIGHHWRTKEAPLERRSGESRETEQQPERSGQAEPALTLLLFCPLTLGSPPSRSYREGACPPELSGCQRLIRAKPEPGLDEAFTKW